MKKLKFQGAIKWVWDFDGTTLNNASAHHGAVNVFIEALGGNKVTQSELQEEFTVPVNTFYERRGCNMDRLMSIVDLYYQTYEQLAVDTQPHEYVAEIIALLFSKGVRQVILSNNTQAGVEHHLRRIGLEPYFARVMANDNGSAVVSKQHKRLLVIEMLRTYQPEHLVLVGDTVEEIQIASEFGIRSIALVSGYQSRQRLEAEKPTLLLESYLPLLEMLRADIF